MAAYYRLVSDPSYRGLRRSLVAGALFDAAFGLPALLSPDWLTARVGVEMADPVLYRLVGLLLVMLAAVYALAAADPGRYRGNVAVAIAGRTAGCGLLAWCWATADPAPAIYLAVAIADGVFAALHGWLGPGLLRAG